MMGVLSDDAVKADWLKAFERLAVEGKIRLDMTEPGHHDGWGLAGYPRPGFPRYLEREPHSVTLDPSHFREGTEFLERSGSRAALVHFRKASEGGRSIANTHPFLYKEWAFCHNGTIFDHESIPLGRLRPSGGTDSERFFLCLMEHLDPGDPEGSIRKAAEEIRSGFRYSSLTFLLTDGKSLYAYRELDLEYSDYYTLYLARSGGSWLAASEPLRIAGLEWEPVAPGSFLKLDCEKPAQVVE
ncbi:MAG: hypothetical protein A2902_01940 [Elusimicrobia bacterium RIFCSPLOWO2_01_FULL_64_13]|nr:MAG: hypothetical protein A2902_01940 [Elusimicrobia bacterium RIFCSPLOWO2_01_FULL_64_13]